MVELVIVLMVGAMVAGMASRGYVAVANERAVGNARDAMIQTAFRARAEAMRTGSVVFMHVRPDSGLVRVEAASGAQLYLLDAAEYEADMVGPEMSLCYTARGYALPGCSTIDRVRGLGFARGGDTAAVAILPLGQIWRVR